MFNAILPGIDIVQVLMTNVLLLFVVCHCLVLSLTNYCKEQFWQPSLLIHSFMILPSQHKCHTVPARHELYQRPEYHTERQGDINYSLLPCGMGENGEFERKFDEIQENLRGNNS